MKYLNISSFFLRENKKVKEKWSAGKALQREEPRENHAFSHSPLKGRMLWGALGAAGMVLVALAVLVACPAAPGPGTGLASVTEVAAALRHTCALLEGGRLKCWGDNDFGQLGQGHTRTLGDSTTDGVATIPTIDLGTGRTATQIVANGGFGTVSTVTIEIGHSCALLDNGSVKCWGHNAFGQLGLGDGMSRGDGPGEMGNALPAIDLGRGRTATQLAAGNFHSCALLDNGSVKCWGGNSYGELGLGDTNDRGDGPGEMGDSLPAIDLESARTATQVAASGGNSCALLDNRSVKCWGHNLFGQLGQGHTRTLGDSTTDGVATIPAINLGSGQTATQLALGEFHACALLDNRSVKCWGDNVFGQLGLGDTDARGDELNEMGDSLPAIDLGNGRTATQLAAGRSHSCALLDNGSVKCWGWNNSGQLGLGDTGNRGDELNEMGDNLPIVDLGSGRTATQIALGGNHSCALLDNRRVKCWGRNNSGQLGLGDTGNRGDELNEMGDNLPIVDLQASR